MCSIRDKEVEEVGNEVEKESTMSVRGHMTKKPKKYTA
jgi:hypothetical protein